MRLDVWFIALALMFLMAGEALGEWMARTHDHSAALIHSHVTVFGWVSLALFGLIHRAYPVIAGSKLALPQFLLASVSTLFFVGGMWVIWMVGDPFGAIIGAYGLLLATAMFVFMFFQRVALVAEANNQRRD